MPVSAAGRRFNWVLQVDLQTALKLQQSLADLVGAQQLVVKTAALEDVIEKWPSSALRRAQSSHSGTILAYESGLSLSRSIPMPPL